MGPGFEGGQMPLVRRLPKRGFTSHRGERMEVVNIGRLNVFDDGAVVDAQSLAAKGLIRRRNAGVKILGAGELSKRLEVRAAAYSLSARKKIEEVKGTAQIEAVSSKPAADKEGPAEKQGEGGAEPAARPE